MPSCCGLFSFSVISYPLIFLSVCCFVLQYLQAFDDQELFHGFLGLSRHRECTRCDTVILFTHCFAFFVGILFFFLFMLNLFIFLSFTGSCMRKTSYSLIVDFFLGLFLFLLLNVVLFCICPLNFVECTKYGIGFNIALCEVDETRRSRRH